MSRFCWFAAVTALFGILPQALFADNFIFAPPAPAYMATKPASTSGTSTGNSDTVWFGFFVDYAAQTPTQFCYESGGIPSFVKLTSGTPWWPPTYQFNVSCSNKICTSGAFTLSPIVAGTPAADHAFVADPSNNYPRWLNREGQSSLCAVR